MVHFYQNNVTLQMINNHHGIKITLSFVCVDTRMETVQPTKEEHH
jgi:hypothetical protein